MMEKTDIPPYVYSEDVGSLSLLQGDILVVENNFHGLFTEFYPAIKHSAPYVMVLTQSCDLVSGGKRKPKIKHINVCPVRSLKSHIEKYLINEIKPYSIADKKILEKDAIDILKDRLSKLLNNADQKTHFFLPKKLPFNENMVAIIPLSFSFRVEHYDDLLKNRVLSLKPEFRAKIGHIISQLYGRIATPDLVEHSWSDKQIRNYINGILEGVNLMQVPDRNYIEYLRENIHQSLSPEELIQEYGAKQAIKSFEPMKKELIQQNASRIIRLFEDKKKISELMEMDKRNLSKEIKQLLSSENTLP